MHVISNIAIDIAKKQINYNIKACEDMHKRYTFAKL